MVVHGPRLERKQGFLFRIVDVANELFAMSASVSRALALARAGRPEAPRAAELAERFCEGSARKVEGLFRALWDSPDADDYALGLSVMKGEHAWMEKGAIGLGLSAEELKPRLPPEKAPAGRIGAAAAPVA
jgi:hypothetical protein